MDIKEQLDKILREKDEKLNKEVTTVQEAVEFFEYAKEHCGRDSCWSIQYWGFGEHFTHWRGDGTFTDFNIDHGQGIDWNKMKEILVESANNLREAMIEEMKVKQ